MATQIDVCNMALAHLGVTEGIQNIQSDRTPQGIYCRLFFGTVLRKVLGEVPWPFATKIQPLALIGSSGAAGFYSSTAYWASGATTQIMPIGNNSDQTEYGYTYAYPSDCLQFRRILSGSRNDSRRMRVPYRIMTVNGQASIVCDMPNAIAEYTADVEDLTLVSDEFILAVSYLLASTVSSGLTKGDTSKGNLAFQKYQMMVAQAEASALNEEQADIVPESDFIRGR